MQNKIKVKSSEIRESGKYYLITTEKGIILGDWRQANEDRRAENFERESKKIEPLEVGKEYAVEWEYSRDGKYKNIKYAGSIDEKSKFMEEI